MRDAKKTVLALYPNRNGVAYALFASQTEPIDFGVGYIRPTDNTKTLKRIGKYIAHYGPDIIVTRNLDGLGRGRSRRIQKLIDMICREASSQGLGVRLYTRTQIKDTFQQFGAVTKYAISKKLIEWYPQLKGYSFQPRKRWMNENPNTAVFDAMSLATVHWYLEG